jgi:hypothetical protein
MTVKSLKLNKILIWFLKKFIEIIATVLKFKLLSVIMLDKVQLKAVLLIKFWFVCWV